VAVSLALFGEEAAFITRLPKNDVAEACIQRLRGLGVDTRLILRGGERIGITSWNRAPRNAPRRSLTTAPTARSRKINPADLNWETLLKGADWFHFTGITPALSDQAAQAALVGARAAKKLGITVSCDLNYRKKLWTTRRPGR